MKRLTLCILFLAAFAAPSFSEEVTIDGGADIQVRKRSLLFHERSADPSTPASNGMKLFAKDDGGTTKLYTKDSAGTVAEVGAGGSGSVSDDVYGSGWDGETGTAPSQNAVYDKIETLAGGHDAVTLAGTPDYITLSGQVITRNAVDLAADITGTLPVANGGTGAATLTDGGILLGSGTGAVTPMGVLADGSIVVGDGTTDPVALAAFTSSTGDLKHEAGGLEFDASAVAIGDIIAGSGAGTMALVTSTGHNDGDVLTRQSDGSVDWEAPSATDSAAIHDNVAAEISAITAKATPVAADFLLIEDSAASDAKKSATIASLEPAIETFIDTLANLTSIQGQTFTLAGAFITSGANSLTLTTTGATNVTLPTTGTLVNTAVTALTSLASVGTVTSGTWGTGAVIAGATVNGVLLYDGTPNSDHSAVGPATVTFNAGATIAAMDLVYMGSGGEWLLTDADAAATACGTLAIATEAGTDGNAMDVALHGAFVRDDTWNWTVGATLYIDTATPGQLTATSPSGTDDVFRVVGYAVTADVIHFVPASSCNTIA